MKNQFTIKPANSVKAIAKPFAKSESTNLLKFFAMGSSCERVMPEFAGLTKPVFSL